MTISLRISRSGLALIKSFEGFRERATRLPDGRWVVGYGHVKSAREGVRVSQEDAEALLIYDLKPIEQGLDDLVFSPLNQNQHDAIVSFVSNISLGLFQESEVLRRLNVGDHLGAAQAMDVWRKARINGQVYVVDALVRRRAIEKSLFLEHPDGRATAATPLVAPQLDTELQLVSFKETSKTQNSDVESMTSAIEELLANGSPIPETAQPVEDIKDILSSSETAEFDEKASEDNKVENKITNTDVFDVADLDEKEIVFIGDKDDEVFQAIGAEVDDALKQAEQDVNPVAETTEENSAREEDGVEFSEREVNAFDAMALAVGKVERLVANDDAPKKETNSVSDKDAELVAVIADLKADEKTQDLDLKYNQGTPEEIIQELLAENLQDEATETENDVKPASATPGKAASAVAERLQNIFEPEVLSLSEELKENAPDISDENDEVSSRDAWNLSEELKDDDINDEVSKPEVKEGYGYATETIQSDAKYIDDLEEASINLPELNEAQDIEGGQAGRRLWLSALIASLAIIVFGIVDFYNKARPGHAMNQSTIAFGPLMIAIGGVVFLMAAYFLISRRKPAQD